MGLKRGLRLRTHWWLIALVTSLLVTGITLDRTLTRLDNAFYDRILRARAGPSSDSILLVEIDDQSLRRIGSWPWNRAVHAALIDRLQAARPRAIAYDVLFTEPGEPGADEELGRAIGGGTPTFLPMLLSAAGDGSQSVVPTFPIRPVHEAATGVGFTTIDPDPDGVVRSATLVAGATNQWRHLMMLVVQALGATGSVKEETRPQLIPFAGRSGHWSEVSAASVLAGEVPRELLEGKIVVVGATASGLASQYATPAGGVMTGLEIEANLLNGLVGHQLIERAGLPLRLALALVPLWVLMLAIGPIRRIPALASLLLCCGVVLFTSAAALTFLRLWLPPAASLAGLAITYPLWGWRQLASIERYMRAELERFESEPGLLPQPAPSVSRSGVASTITLLRNAIGRNREMRHFVADRLNQLPDATLVVDLTGQVVLANAAAHSLFALFGRDLSDHVDIDTLLSNFQQSGAGSKSVPFPPIEGEPFTCEAQFDKTHFFLITMAEQTSMGGQRAGWIIRFVDVSEAKSAQRQRDDIVQLLTHDMRSPQASILAVLETGTPDRIHPQEASRIRHYAERTLGLADGFVQLARAENLDYAIEEIALTDMLMDAIDDLWPQSQAKAIDIVLQGNEPLLVLGERSLLTRAFLNVIGNAIKYSYEHTTITCTTSREVWQDGSTWAQCAITDQGPGLDSHQQRTIFERFHRGSVGLGPKTDGVGLGLSFVHTVIARHNGQIDCDSQPGSGATFTISLPASN
ncbi:integral membrane sensor signal transduction histidine kinase [Novosphingobium sp. Rr 2-17]|uniref:CHASE2 domain-containing protein n=1 Tax=Novosphingobium sp. Rr 2-17 TaxID=555793 RepID=UPI000269A504|nr:CHASE2 domain-containing protein [Novosphingobium sp. Rr 2-17]EIZ79185.1 integral membrane sensor signal transduction histidine kinase [Novosphingobium sp. Rr 2-17]